MSKILIVDDELNIRQLLYKYLKFDGFETDEAENGLKAIEKANNNQYDLIIMDIMMPELDGFSAIKEIRKTSNVPVIMLSARSEEYDKLYGFDLGIDDYVTKPFSPKELLMRIHAVINRYNSAKQEQKVINDNFIMDGLKIDYSAYVVYVDEKKVDLTNKEYELLVFLIKNKNVAVKREVLLEKIWGYQYYGDDRTLDTHMKSLRKKIGKYGECIITIRRVGYRFDVSQN